jgi:DEAD/DEAH box helicase domain-containing protein
MDDPLGAFETIQNNFLLYIKTAFCSQFPSFEVEREALLKNPGVLCQEPWIEPILSYESSGKPIADIAKDDLPGFSEILAGEFRDLTRCGLVGEYPLYSHQAEMLKLALQKNNCIITSGTGSGKTEAFLLPLFAELIRESKSWQPPGTPDLLVNNWWKNENWIQKWRKEGDRECFSPRKSQRGHEKRDTAVRALILYPMNALVEDQLTRLREALDSTSAQQWFKGKRGGHRFYFGRYNSSTPVAGNEFSEYKCNAKAAGNAARKPNKYKIEKLISELGILERSYSDAIAYAANTGKYKAQYFFPNI